MKRYLVPAVLLVGLVLLVLGPVNELSRSRTFQLFGELVSRVETDQPIVALTFDDGPTPRYTNVMIEMLDALDVTATFYVNGQPATEHAEQAAALVAAGHDLGNHAWLHDRMVLVTPWRVRREIEDTTAALRAAGFDGEITFRPPYGRKLVVLPWVLAGMGITTVMWDVEPETVLPAEASAEDIASHVIENAEAGSIVLLHVMFDSREQVRQAVPLIVEGLRARGFRFVTVNALLANRP